MERITLEDFIEVGKKYAEMSEDSKEALTQIVHNDYTVEEHDEDSLTGMFDFLYNLPLIQPAVKAEVSQLVDKIAEHLDSLENED